MSGEKWGVARTIEEVETMAKCLDGDGRELAHPSWYGGSAIIFGSDTAWPLLVRIPKFIADGHEVTPLDVEHALEHLDERIDFLIEKADDERGLSASKARDQVNMLLWLLDREDLMIPLDAGFESSARFARQLKEKVGEAMT